MGRRFTTGASINRFFASIRANNARKERAALISQSSSTAKELPTKYHLESVDFDPTTRLTSITILSTKQYRTIEKYVTQNYVRYPIYSYWKTKTTHINKKVKLTNQALEGLKTHSDDLVRKFADEIILSLHDETLIPSWLMREIIENDYKATIDEYHNKITKLDDNFAQRVIIDKEITSSYTRTLNLLNGTKNTLNKDIEKILNKQKHINRHKHDLWLFIITMGIYKYYCSAHREKRLQIKLQNKIETLKNTENEINTINANIQKIRDTQAAEKAIKDQKIADIRWQISDAKKERDDKLSAILPLSTTVETSDYIPLKNYIGLEYQKIIGCYIIHNKERDKYYVGQSKDVMKRLKQHFKGTTPNNMIFAEDYFKSKLSSKDELFEVKVIPLNTKDELDATEARLIEEYEANTKGYNSTKGNS